MWCMENVQCDIFIAQLLTEQKQLSAFIVRNSNSCQVEITSEKNKTFFVWLESLTALFLYKCRHQLNLLSMIMSYYTGPALLSTSSVKTNIRLQWTYFSAPKSLTAIITAHIRSIGKVMFSQASIILFIGGCIYDAPSLNALPRCTPPPDTLPGCTLPGCTPPPPPPRRQTFTCGRYASYMNAYLFQCKNVRL